MDAAAVGLTPAGRAAPTAVAVVVLVEVLVKELSGTHRRGEITEFAGAFVVMLNLV